MGNKKIVIKEETWKALFKWAFPILLIIWTVYFCVMREIVIAIISAILTLVTSLHSFGFFPNIKTPKQEDNCQKDKKQSRCRMWWNCNFKWFFLTNVIVLFCLTSLSYTVPRIINNDGGKKSTKEKMPDGSNEDTLAIVEEQRQFDDLVGYYESRMNERITLNNADRLIADYDSLQKILQILDKNMNYNAKPKKHYKDQYKRRAKEAIEIINIALHSDFWNLSESKQSEYELLRNAIKEKKNSL